MHCLFVWEPQCKPETADISRPANLRNPILTQCQISSEYVTAI
jgi:hypothetical protein